MARVMTPAVVLRTVDYGEADRVVTLLCREGGKRSALARGARRSSKRFGAGLSLFGVGEATLLERPGAEARHAGGVSRRAGISPPDARRGQGGARRLRLRAGA